MQVSAALTAATLPVGRATKHVSEIVKFMETGTVQPRVDRVFPLEEAIQAFELFERNEGRGKTVVCFKED